MSKLSGTFGWDEMENVASRIVDTYNATGEAIINISSMMNDRHALEGFSELIACGWIEPYPGKPNPAGQPLVGFWQATQKFFDRVNECHPEAFTRNQSPKETA